MYAFIYHPLFSLFCLLIAILILFSIGDSCKMGSTVVRGEVEGTVEFTGANSFFGRTASLLQVS